MKVYKHILKNDISVIMMNTAARVLHVENQNEEICMWVTHCDMKENSARSFFIVGTGQEFEAESSAYRGTVMLQGGKYVFHVFERD